MTTRDPMMGRWPEVEKVACSCVHCGRTFLRKQSAIRGRTFCNATCYGRWRTAHHYGPGAGRWAGGRYKTPAGYVRVSAPLLSDNERRLFGSMITGNKQAGSGYIFEHRLAMARHMGRALKRGEQVHHKNGRPDDNRIENLALLSDSKHKRSHKALLRENQRLRREVERLSGLLRERQRHPCAL